MAGALVGRYFREVISRCLHPSVRLLALALAVVLVGTPLEGQEGCPAAAASFTDAGWTAYGQGEIDAAERAFEAALDRCPDDAGATDGLGYVRLRQGRDIDAAALFGAVLERAPTDVDALVGMGLVAWRAADRRAAREYFERVLDRVPDHPTALAYLERLPRVPSPAAERPPLVVPDTLVYPARVRGDGFEVRGVGGWRPFYVKGVNLGAALPGRHPSQFPDSATYARWLDGLAEMGANTVRLYTIHPPSFYRALLDHNRRSPENPVWVIHGVWAELPPDDDYLDPEWEGEFFGEMRRVVDVVHGRAEIEPRPGRASGSYAADVSPWVLAYIIGREWEPFSVEAFNARHPDLHRWAGRYLTLGRGTPMDVWLAKASEEIVSYETRTYRAQRPVAYTNWPTLDPLQHPTEPTIEEELAIRRALGETIEVLPKEYDNDAVALDATLVQATERLPAGYFASYHAYPYYPDFMILQPEYRDAASSLGPSSYFGYLRDLKRHHGDMAVLVAEYGVPASLGNAHLQPQGWHHGGHGEQEMAAIDRRLTLELAEAGMAGGVLFAWLDEWFKRNWLVTDFELPPDRNRLWYNRLDAEQHYGMLAVEADPAVPGGELAERMGAWRDVPPVLATSAGDTLRLASDEAYLWLLAQPRPGSAVERELGSDGDEAELLVGFDVIDPQAGDTCWPGCAAGESLPVGVEFVLRASGDEVRLLVDPPQNPWRVVDVAESVEGLTGRTIDVDEAPAGFFRGRVEQRLNLPYYTVPNADGRYDSLRVVINRRRFGRDSVEYLAMGYDRGVLLRGAAPDGLWERLPGGRALEVRIPWMLLNVTDPSSRRVLQGPGDDVAGAVRDRFGRWGLRGGVRHWPDTLAGHLGTEVVDDIRVLAATVEGGAPGPLWTGADGEGVTGRFTWPTWEEPRWASRRRPVFEVMRRTFAELEGEAVVAAPQVPGAQGAATSDTVPSREEADAAWSRGDTEEAERLYTARLEANPEDAQALHRRALLYAWGDDFDEGLQLFDRLLALSPENFEARVDRARVLAWSGDTEGALEAVEGVLEEEPTFGPALEARALFLAWAGRLEASLSAYDQLLAVAPEEGGARRTRARVLIWAEQYEAARAVYDSILGQDPEDVDARLGLARLLAYSGRLDEAVEAYRVVLGRHPGQAEARRQLARTLGWRGSLVEAEQHWRGLLAAQPRDLESRTGLARNLRWQGRDAASLEVLEAATDAERSRPELREELRWVSAALGPRARSSLVFERDSDGNRMWSAVAESKWNPIPRLSVGIEAYGRELEQGALGRRAWGGLTTLEYQLEPGWRLGLGAGGSDSDAGRGTASALSLSATSPARYPAGAGVRFRRAPLDATALLAERGIVVEEAAVDLRWSPGADWRLRGGGGWAEFEGTEKNTRWNGSASAVRPLGGQWSVGAAVRTFGFEKDLTDGYFDPDFYGIAEVTGAWRMQRQGWSARVEAAPGLQQVGRDGPTGRTVRASATLGYHFGPGREISSSVGFSSTGLQSFSTGDSDYRYVTVVLGGSWAF